MALQLRWAGIDEAERVARTRLLCYAHASNQFERFRESMANDPRATGGDFLLAEQNGQPVGTATSLSMTMWVRGSAVACQGVSWVGTIKTHRRRAGSGEGIATRIMRDTLRMARERQQVVSALMPFRASFYEHFGYGIVERRNEWTVPLAVLPHGDSEGIRFFEAHDLPELSRCRQRAVERGQCDIERHQPGWDAALKKLDDGFVLVDRAEADGPVRGFQAIQHQHLDGKDLLRVNELLADDTAALRRQLHFLASLKDQYSSAVLTLPMHLPLNRLLREGQVPHRPVNHAHADLRSHTRMQVRVLDHKRLIEAMRLPSEARGRVVVEVGECEGHSTRLSVDLADGRAQVSATQASAAFACPDHVWAAVVLGDLPATEAIRLGVASGSEESARLLDALSAGPAPFCNEYF